MIKIITSNADFIVSVIDFLARDPVIGKYFPAKFTRISPAARKKKINEILTNIRTVKDLEDLIASPFIGPVPVVPVIAVATVAVAVHFAVGAVTWVLLSVGAETYLAVHASAYIMSEADTGTETTTETSTSTETETGTETATETETTTATETETATETTTETETMTEVLTETETETETETDTRTDTETDTLVDTSTDTIVVPTLSLTDVELRFIINSAVLADNLAMAVQSSLGPRGKKRSLRRK